MGRTEFIEILQRTLATSLSSSLVNSNIHYYQDYIDTEIRQGRSEEEVIASLGDPRLLAKTIVEAGKHEGRSLRPEYDEVYEEGQAESAGDGYNSKVYKVQGWMVIVLVIVMLLVIIGIVGSIMSILLPLIIPFICVVFIIRFFHNRK